MSGDYECASKDTSTAAFEPDELQPGVVRDGGYEYKFVEEVPERLQCMICTKPLRDPHLSGCCGQHFCYSCLQQWFKKQKKEVCPHCRTENFSHLLNKERQREIAALNVCCTFKTEGCQWTGELSSLDNHLEAEDGCDFIDITCTNECGNPVRRKDLQHHLTEECWKRMYQCEHCGHEGTYEDIATTTTSRLSHYNRCELYPLQCPNNCGEKKIMRNDMAAHRDTCPREELECHFHKAGCTEEIQRCDFDKHMEQNTQQHLLLMMKELTRISQENKRISEENERISQENERISEENERISEENKSLKAEIANCKKKKGKK